MGDTYYVCPDCGYKQKSEAEKRISCHRCNRSYLRRTAKQTRKAPDEETGDGFVKFTKDDDS